MLNKKRVVAVAVTGLASLVMLSNASAIESANGLYLGGQAGWGTLHQDGFNMSTSSTTDDGIAGRLFTGFKFNDYVALESGYTKFTNMNSNINVSGVNFNDNIQAYSVDLVVKGILPLSNGFDLYGKVGAAYLNEVESVSGSVPNVTADLGSETEAKILPTFGLGLSYAFSPNLSGDVSWMHIQKVDDTSFINNTDFMGVGLTYNFG